MNLEEAINLAAIDGVTFKKRNCGAGQRWQYS